ncbi:hypothetical protein C6P40_004021 [Pichia californica]|uniref:Uncharacterized protein n=1 Tax=Pichia californica TaxID=460514 RepID=A0A9P6WQ26_9ASCO|nr:hypothetical protein C6P42_002441 [[Candida] californica]KAG0691209.1 hypothetical protein C6P40_004021 [[Candida] californica]
MLQKYYHDHHNRGTKCITKYSNSRPFLILYSNRNNTNNKNNNDKEIDTKLLTRKANLGTIIQMLQLKIPFMLTDLLPKDFISEKIILRILPNQFPNLPIFKGYLMYCSTLKAIQKILLMFYLNPESKIHISNIKIIEPTNSLSSDELINISIDNNVLENNNNNNNNNINNDNKQDISKYTTKIKVKWRTCYSGCNHLRNLQTTDAKLGSYSLDHFDWTKFLKSSNPLQTLSLLEAKKTIEGLAKTLDPSINEHNDNINNNIKNNNSNNNGNNFTGRILTGVFIFELDAENEHVMVLTIDNMEILESKQTNFIDGCLA